MKHFLGRIWNPVFAVIDLKKATIKIKDGSTGSLVSVAGGAAEWTDSPTTPGEAYYTGAAMTAKPVVVELGGVDISASEGTIGALVENEWCWGDQDTLGASTMYIKLPGDGDPDALAADYLKMALAITANEITITIGEGNLSYTRAKTIEYILDRGNLGDVREGDQVPLDVSLDFQWDYISGLPASSIPTIEEALAGDGEASDWTSTDSDACRPYAVDIEITYLPTPSTCGDQEIITLPDFRWESLDHDLRAGTIAVSGKCNVVVPTAVRSAQ
jgi:hypothetical protein